MSLMRRRAAGAAAAIVLLGFAAQPTLRWVVACAMSRAIQSSVLIRGDADGSFREQTLTLHRIEVPRENRPSIEIERVSALLQPWELLQRNLVVERAFADGVAIRCGHLETGIHATPSADALLPVPTFEPDRFLEQSVGPLQRMLEQERSHRSRFQSELETRTLEFDHRQQQGEHSEEDASGQRAFDERLRKEYVLLRQKIAEERIAIREAAHKTRSEIEVHQSSLPARLRQAIEGTLPNFEATLQEGMAHVLLRLLDEVDPLLETSLECMLPVVHPTDPTRGFDVAIPGLENPCTWVRSARLKGWFYPSGNHRVPFDCRLSHWGDVASDVATPSAEWLFHFPKTQSEIEINHLRRATQAGGTPILQSRIRRSGAGDRERDRVELTLEFRAHGCQIALDAPLQLTSVAGKCIKTKPATSERLANGGADSVVAAIGSNEAPASRGDNTAWLECLAGELESATDTGGVRIRLIGNNLPMMNLRLRPSANDLRLDPRTLFELEPIWSRARSRYVAQTVRATLPLLAASESRSLEESRRFAERVTEHQLAVLEKVELSLDRWKEHWETGARDARRVARKP